MSRDEHLNWFHGKLSRESADELIKQGNEDGTFLVRESSTAAGDFVLTLLYKNEVCHYQIRRHGEDAFFSIDDKIKILHGLETLIDFYQQANNGLVTQLTVPLKKDPPPHNTRSHGSTNLLHRATKQNDSTVVSEMLKVGYRNFDAKNQDGQTALHLAALYCDEPILKLLLNAGVNANSMDSFGYQPLHYACRSKPASFIRVLIDANANVQGRNIQNGYVPLHEAAKYGNLAAVKELLAAHAPHLPRTKSGEFPFDLAKEAEQKDVEQFLENYKIPASNTSKDQWYHGTLSREEAVVALNKFAHDMEATAGAEKQPVDTSGCYLVRYSEKSSGGYVLTLLCDKQVKNFRISQAGLFQNVDNAQQTSVCKYLYIDDGPYWPSLEHLIEHFMRFSYGLPISLKYPVPPKPKPQLPSFSTIPRTPQKRQTHPAIAPKASISGATALLSTNSEHAAQAAERHAQTLASSSAKKKQKESTSVFNTLRLRSPKFDMNSLRKSKSKTKRSDSEGSALSAAQSKEEELQKAQSLLKSLSFSTDFVNVNADAAQVDGGEVYNVPKNNAAINNTPIELEAKTEAEVEYFTKSDVAIERERLQAAAIGAPVFPINANGYLPTVDTRIFLDDKNPEAMEMSAAELREFAKHPERLDSFISIVSTESEMARYLNRQFSATSTQSTTPTSASVAAEQTRLNYFIPADCLKLDCIIGEGEFGSVYKGSLRRGSGTADASQEQHFDVAIKTLRDEHCRSNKQEFLREASVMIKLQHHCIVRLIGISKGETLMMVQELVPLGSMLHFILENRAKINPKFELKLWASQIACGMQYLESQHFVHRDLAARNILLASRNQVKISDFGLSRNFGSGSDCYQATQGGKWPIKWYAPESYNNGIFSHASDVWSFGVTLWEMFSLGEPPFGDLRGVDAIELIESGQRLPQPILCPEYIYEIMKNCWHYKAKERPTFRYLTDFFIKDPNYQNLGELVKTVHIS